MPGPYDKHGALLRVAYLLMALLTWPLVRLLRRGEQTIVLCYHGVKPHQAARFAWQVRRVAERAVGVPELTASGTPRSPLTSCSVGPPSPARAEQPVRDAGLGGPALLVRTTKSPFRSPAVCFTFDDAFANLLDNTLPALRELGVPACIFAVADNLGDRPRWRIAPDHPDADERTMTAEELRRVAESELVTVGSHTCTHPDLARLAPAELLRELQDSRAKLADLVGRPIDDLALPHGSYTPAVLEAAFAAGYRRVYTLEATPHTPVGDGPQVVGRFLMSPDAWRIEFLLTCAGAYAWLHPWRRLLHRLRHLGRKPAPAVAHAEPVSA